jgi:hypothetical protein
MRDRAMTGITARVEMAGAAWTDLSELEILLMMKCYSTGDEICQEGGPMKTPIGADGT